nr:outer membrane protein assembly factor BamA [Ameyamaea chiangmaiensis]
MAAVVPVTTQAQTISHAQTRRKAPAPRPQTGGVIQAIEVSGNDRIETSTILSYMVVQVGDPFNQDELDRSLKTLYASGLFKDVTLHRAGATLQVHVVENPVVNRISFEGNSAAKDEDLRKVIDLRSRAVFSTQTVASDRQKILQVYAEKARYAATVTPQIIKLSHNRVDVVFQINEARQTLVNKVSFVGNKAFSEARLAQVISSKEHVWYRFFSSSDEYNPERLKYDAELLRRFYLRNGYVDFNMIDATGELSPDHKSFYVTFTLHEGERYRLGKVEIRSALRHVDAKSLYKYVELFPHQWYDGTAIQHNADDMQEILQAKGNPFAVVRPEIARNPEKRIVNLLFDVGEGPRMYVERIDINGNTITQDKVIRRQMPMAEGDPYTSNDKKYTKEILEDMGYFSSASVDQSQGSAPDRVNVAANVVEKPTGEFSLGGGYSTDIGILGNASLKQHNLLGSGVDAGISGTVGYYQKQADLSVSDPYFMNRNLVAGVDIYMIQNSYQTYQSYSEGRYGITLRMGYAYNRHLSQSWNYSLVDRHVNNSFDLGYALQYGYGYEYQPSVYIRQQTGWSLLSQIGTELTYDTRDNRMRPHSGYVLHSGVDFAGAGGDEKYVRAKFDAAYYVPLDSITGSHDWTLSFKAGTGYLVDWGNGRQDVIDNFYLGGNNLRGFLDGGAGPRSAHQMINGVLVPAAGQEDLIGGRFIYTGSAQVNFPMPLAKDMGITGRYFVDAGGLAGVRVRNRYTNYKNDGANYTPISGDSVTPRVSTGVGFSWKSPFGLINIDAAIPLHRYRNDRTQVLRFGFGQQF